MRVLQFPEVLAECRSYIHALIMLTRSIKQLLMLLIFSSETDIEATAYEHTKTKVEK